MTPPVSPRDDSVLELVERALARTGERGRLGDRGSSQGSTTWQPAEALLDR